MEALQVFEDKDKPDDGCLFQQANGVWVAHSIQVAKMCASSLPNIAAKNGYTGTKATHRVGKHIFTISPTGIIKARTMTNITRIRKYHDAMTRGEKQYMANKLWKDDRVLAQKLERYVPDDVMYPHVGFKGGQMFHTGSRDRGDNRYMLVQPDRCAMALVSMQDGNRWKEPVMVLNPLNISTAEWNKITGGKGEETFTPIEVA
jgi:hypothetical protein